MKNAGVLVSALGLAGGVLDGREYFAELRREVMLECDYRVEAGRRDRYARAAARFGGLFVPAVARDLSSRRVLSLEFVEGRTLLEISHGGSQDERDRCAELLNHALWGPFLDDRIIHADPHPGNFVLLADGRLAVLDFGAVKELSARFVHAYERLLRADVAAAPIDVLDTLLAAGFTMSGGHDETAAFLEEIHAIVRRPLAVERYDWGADRMIHDLRALFLRRAGTALRLRPPVEGLLFYRALAGFAMDQRLLRARGRTLAAVREVLAGGRDLR